MVRLFSSIVVLSYTSCINSVTDRPGKVSRNQERSAKIRDIAETYLQKPHFIHNGSFTSMILIYGNAWHNTSSPNLKLFICNSDANQKKNTPRGILRVISSDKFNVPI
jgi:hypothetical protein